MRRLRRGACVTGLVATLVAVTACRREPAGGPPPAAGEYIVLDDSSSVQALVVRDGRTARVEFPDVVGSVTLEVKERGLLLGNGSFTLDLGSATFPDSVRARALATDVFEIERGVDFRTARLAVRQLFGKRLVAGLPVGDAAPVTVRGQLVLHGMAITHDFEGEITRTSRGYRLVTSEPQVLSLRQLGLDDEVAAWAAATGGGAVLDPVLVTASLTLVRRGPP